MNEWNIHFKVQLLRKPDSGLMQLAMSPAFDACGQIRRQNPDHWSSRGKGHPPGAKQAQTEAEGAGGLTSPHGAVRFSSLCVLVDAIVAWVKGYE